MNKNTFPERLRKLRENRKLSQIDLAKIMNVSNGSISKWERGERQPDYDTLKKISNFFNVTTDYLVGQSDSRTTNVSKIDGNYFNSPQEALSFLLKQEMFADFGGYDLETMSNEEIMTMANDTADMMKIILRKHQK